MTLIILLLFHANAGAGFSRELLSHPAQLKPDYQGELPPSALIPFCSYQGESTLLGQRRPELNNITVCDKFEPSIQEGQLCYSLDISKVVNKSSKVEKPDGLWILVDPNPYALNASSENKPEFKVFVHTLASYTAFGPGKYAMNALKKMSGTESFKQLPENQKMCQNHNREECETAKFLDQVEMNCDCVPWGLVTDINKEMVVSIVTINIF